jgi:hypothetical protein
MIESETHATQNLTIYVFMHKHNGHMCKYHGGEENWPILGEYSQQRRGEKDGSGERRTQWVKWGYCRRLTLPPPSKGEKEDVSKLRLLSSSSSLSNPKKGTKRWLQYHSSPPSIQLVRIRQNYLSYLNFLFKYDIFIIIFLRFFNKAMVKGDVKVNKYFLRVRPTRNPHAHNGGPGRSHVGGCAGPMKRGVSIVGPTSRWVRDIPPRVITSPVALPTSALLTFLLFSFIWVLRQCISSLGPV